LLGVDGVKAWPAAAGPRVILGAVNHQKKVFTPASAVWKEEGGCFLQTTLCTELLEETTP